MTFQNEISRFSQSDHSYAPHIWTNTMILWQLIIFGIICINSRNDWCWHVIDCAYWIHVLQTRTDLFLQSISVFLCTFRTVMLRTFFLSVFLSSGNTNFWWNWKVRALFLVVRQLHWAYMVFVSHLPGLKLAQKCLQCNNSCRVSSVWSRHREITSAV